MSPGITDSASGTAPHPVLSGSVNDDNEDDDDDDDDDDDAAVLHFLQMLHKARLFSSLIHFPLPSKKPECPGAL